MRNRPTSKLICGDCLDVMPTLPADSVHAIVTDPPYGLEFMGKEWDKLGDCGKLSHSGPSERDGSTVFGRQRVAYSASGNVRCLNCGKWKWGHKPGDSGGGGLGCACDKPEWPNAKAHQARIMQDWHYRWAVGALRVAKPGAFMLAFGGTRTFHRLTCAIEDAGWEIRDDIAFLLSLDDREWAFYLSLNADQQQAFLDLFASNRTLLWVYGSGFPKSLDVSKAIDKASGAKRAVVGDYAVTRDFKGREYVGSPSKATRVDITASATDAAKQWDGWGTSLKPAYEPIIVARKPLDGTVANNVLKHGCGGLNVDACRVGMETVFTTAHKTLGDGIKYGKSKPFAASGPRIGRWPANVVHDGSDEVVAGFPESKSSGGTRGGDPGQVYGGGKGIPHPQFFNFGDSGSAARFFYCAKASRSERGKGCNHPTVKPLALMKWLVKLVTPPGGTVLDQFLGSGSTGLACAKLGFNFIGIETDPGYVAIARRRIAETCGLLVEMVPA